MHKRGKTNQTQTDGRHAGNAADRGRQLPEMDKEAEEPKSDEKTKKKEEEVKKMSETVNDKQREMEKENAELKALISDLKSEIKTLKENTAADEDGQGVKKIKNDIDRATTNEEIMKVALKD
jgi:hypothetical protein